LREAATELWDQVLDGGRQYGYRNAQATVLAPTGTISFLMDCDTTGIEPDIALVKYKQLAGGGMLKIVNKTVPPTPGTVPLSIPATFLHDVGHQLGLTGRTGVKVRQYSDYPFPWRTDGGPRDEFEREALRRLRQSKGRETVHEFTEVDGQRVVRYAQARVMDRSCVECHSTHDQSPRKDWQVGDVRGVLEIIRPLDKDEARVSDALRLALLLSAVVSCLSLGGSTLVVWAGRRRIPIGS
jgi:hypothetical protein